MTARGRARRVFWLGIAVAALAALSAFFFIPVVTPHNLWFALGAALLLALANTLRRL